MKTLRSGLAVVTGLIVLMLVIAGGVLWVLTPRAVSEEKVQRIVVTTLQREAPASFYVTGTLDITATSHLTSTTYRQFLPYVPPANFGTTFAQVSMPGRVAYGFDVRKLTPDDITIRDDGVIVVRLPDLEVFSAEPDLGALEASSESGWRAWLTGQDHRETERRAMVHAQRALKQQAEQHLRESREPRLHTAEALEHLLTTPLKAAGVETPRFSFDITPELLWESSG